MEKVDGQQIRQDCARGAAKDTSTHWTGHREERTGDNTEGEGRKQRAEDKGQLTHLIYSFLAASSSTHCGSPGSMYCMKYLRHRSICSARRNITIL
jgi:hypothetical protein